MENVCIICKHGVSLYNKKELIHGEDCKAPNTIRLNHSISIKCLKQANYRVRGQVSAWSWE